LLCGKIASGKSTLAHQLAEAPATLLISEDRWLAALYRDEMNSVADYVRCSAKLRAAMTPHLIALLESGLSVVLDFPANTLSLRKWMRELPNPPLHYRNCITSTSLTAAVRPACRPETPAETMTLPQPTRSSS
jgi:predicted kinase